MKKYLVFVSIFMAFQSAAQITVDATVDETQAMETLLGENVTISNLTWSGVDSQIGIFDCVDCGLDFEAGVIISSGDVGLAVGPNNQGAAGLNVGVGPVNEADMTLAEPTNLQFFDLAILEFDFVALGDSIWFDYIWASDEYPNYINEGGINDQFGFFMSGPGINGIYTDGAENLAVIPGTTDAVTNANINNGNLGTNGPCMNCEYYVHNGTGVAGEPEFTDNTVTQYDGYTTGLRAIQGGLQCGETYHLKICIADVGDGIFDSAVILKAGSLSSNLTVQVELEIEATNEDGVMNEECGLSTLTFSRPEAIASDLPFTVNILYSGDAENGVDYTLLPEQIEFLPGENEISFTLDAFEDGIVEGLELVRLDMQSVAVCEGESVPSSFEFFITEAAPLDVQGYETDICEGDTIEIMPIINGGSGGFLYEWNTLETTESINVFPALTSTYTVAISDTCIAEAGNAEITVNVAQFPPLELSSTPDEITIGCNWFGETVSLQATGGDENYAYEFSTDGGQSTQFGNDFFLGNWNLNGDVIGYVTDGCGNQTQVEIDVEYDIPELEVSIPDSVFTCPGDFDIVPVITGGTEPFNFQWFDQNFNFSTDPMYSGNTSEDMFVDFFISDACGLTFSQVVQVVILTPVDLEIEAGADLSVLCEAEVLLQGEIISGVQPYTITWETLDNQTIGSDLEEDITALEDQTYILTVDDSCGQTQSDSLDLTIDDIPLEITIPSLLTGDCLTQFEIEATTNLENVNISYNWSGPQGMNIIGENTVTYQSLESGIIEVTGDAGCGNITTESTEIVVASPPIVINVSEDATICLDGLAVLSVEASGGSGALSYQWLGAESTASSVTVSPSVETIYGLIVTDGCFNQVTDSVTIDVENVEVTYTTQSDEPYSFLFIPSLEPECDACTYYWSFSDGQNSEEVSPYHTFEQAGYVGAFLEVTTPQGCIAEFSDLLNVPPVVFIPNSFTPDNDGINDAFYVEAEGIDQYELIVFNRWGEIVFQSTDPNEAWVGNSEKGDYFVPEGVYSYVLKFRGLDSDSETRVGTVTVIR